MFYSTNKKSPPVSLKEAVLKGMPDDNGLYMPEIIPSFSRDFFIGIKDLTFQEISFEAAKLLIGSEVAPDILENMVNSAINFDAPLVEVDKNTYVLELFHGPTLAFKDFGARFTAELMSYFVRNSDEELYILVATSGDTGSAVAKGFLNVPGIKVVLLYPSGKVSHIQEKQLTTMGCNILALEVEGVFDDCQKLVKTAFLDKDINEKLNLTSANSINISRLIPQSFYYFYGYSQLEAYDLPLIISVPSGNFGNLTAGLIGKRMGLPVDKFIASTNINDIVPSYLKTGNFIPRSSKKTISNAMDVGNPSNFARILDFYDNDINRIKKDISGFSFTDEETENMIKEIHERTSYILDPHGAVGYLGLEEYRKQWKKECYGIFVETAHPAKFSHIVEPVINRNIEMPERLSLALKKEKRAVYMKNDYMKFKDYLLAL